MYEYEYADKTDTQIKQRMNKQHSLTGYSACHKQMDISPEILLRMKTEEILQGMNNKSSKELNPTTRLKSLGKSKILLERNPQINLLTSIIPTKITIMNSTSREKYAGKHISTILSDSCWG